jgi:hypothetical protein
VEKTGHLGHFATLSGSDPEPSLVRREIVDNSLLQLPQAISLKILDINRSRAQEGINRQFRHHLLRHHRIQQA